MLATELNPQNWGRRMNACSGCPTLSQNADCSSKKIRLSARPKLGDLRLEPPE
ncbi:hypothetical protein B0H12DRAFT_1125724 [Mycena haematopus]|nr:hypothetical protein B0H12DRAFT_1125724 [Mycena haematopus]